MTASETATQSSSPAGRNDPRVFRWPVVQLLAAGALCALALPPLHLLPVLFIGFGVLVWRLDRTIRLRSALATGWLFGAGYFSAGLYWLGLPVVIDVPDDVTRDLLLIAGLMGAPLSALFLGVIGARFTGGSWIGSCAGVALAIAVWVAISVAVLPGRFTWMIPFNVFGLGGLLASTIALATALAWRLAPSGGLRQIIFLAAAWAAFEWVRGVALSGFPWNLVATVWAEFPGTAQSVAWWGPFGLSLISVLLASLPTIFLLKHRGDRTTRVYAGGLAVVLVVILGAGHLLMPADVDPVPNVKLRIVQGSVAQILKWKRHARARILVRYGELTLSKESGSITHVIWPETALPYRLQTQYKSLRLHGSARRFFLSVIPRNGVLITGANRDVGPDTWNSVHVVADDGRVIGTYDKHHLVPFGEYVPARSFLSRIGVAKIAHGRGDYAFGSGPRSLIVPGAPMASPLICYEAIFPAEAVGRPRPGWLLNVTNDAWFGNSAGPYQHFASARLRSIEQGLPMVRAANTGISAVVDPYGRIKAYLPLGTRGILDSTLPQARTTTLYSRIGNLSFIALLLVACLLAWAVPAGRDEERTCGT